MTRTFPMILSRMQLLQILHTIYNSTIILQSEFPSKKSILKK